MILEREITGTWPETSIAASEVNALTAQIGQSSFVDGLMRFGRNLAAADLISVFCLGDRDTPLLIGTASDLGNGRARMAAKAYEQHSSADRNTDLLTCKTRCGDFLTVQLAESVPSFPYRRDCYDRPGIGSRISVIRRRPEYGLSVSLYRARETPVFQEQHYDRLTALLGLMLTMTERHVAFALKDSLWKENDVQLRLALNFPELTDREREVAAMTIKGRTAEEISQILGIAETTVTTHRKKAYQRMNVSNLREMMAIFRT